jgi:site-specific DNA-methyltransferase (adenine-specific)
MAQSEAIFIDNIEGMKRYPDKFFDLAVPDPQYGINAPKMKMGSHPTRKEKGQYPGTSTTEKLKGRLNSGSGKLKNRILNTSQIDWDNEPPTPEYWKQLFRVSKNQMIFGGNYFPLPPSRGVICWDKVQPWPNFSAWEMIWTSFDFPAKIFRYSNTGGANTKNKIHPTEKPAAIYKYLFEVAKLKPGAKILDPNLGSGNSRIVAQIMGFDFVGFENNRMHFEDSLKAYDESINGILVSDKVIITQAKLFSI